MADARAARPVVHGLRRARQREVGIAHAELAREPRQARAEGEDLHTAMRRHGGV
jgi:hypothetical protein